jgi:hypothetical protein
MRYYESEVANSLASGTSATIEFNGSFDGVLVTSSGSLKIELIVDSVPDPVVAFTSIYVPTIDVPIRSTGTFKVTLTNREYGSMDVYASAYRVFR